jgi:hypothetical protein
MSALPPEADIRQRIEHVCFVPKAASPANPLNTHLGADLDHTVSGQIEIAARIIGVSGKQN